MTNWSMQLRENLGTYFNEDELFVLCHDLNVDCENFPDEGKARLVIDLIGYMARNGRLPELIEACRRRRPHVDWDDMLAAARRNPNSFIGQTTFSLPPALHPRRWQPIWLGIAVCAVALLGIAGWLAGRSGETSTLPPRTVGIPFSKTAVTVDGFCDAAGEYSDAFQDTYPDLDAAGQVFFQHDGTNLYACMKGPVGPNPERFITLNFAPDSGSAADIAEIKAVPATGQVTVSPGISGWTSQVTVTQVHDVAEFRVALTAVAANPCTAPFRMAVFHYWMVNAGDDYSWINGYRAGYNQPGIWQRVMLQDCPAS